MKPDPGITPVRRIREAVSSEVGDDPARLVEHYVALQQRFASRLVHAPREATADAAAEGETPGRPREPR